MQPLDRAIELVRVAAGKIGARRAVIRHEQRVADEHRILDLVGDVRRRVPGRVEDLDLELADLEALAILEQMIEVAAVRLQIGGVEDRPEDALHVLDVFADADLGAGLRLDVGRAGQVVGMGVGLQRPLDRAAGLLGGLQHGLDRAGVDLAGLVIVVEHRIDHGGLLGRRIGHQIADRVGGLVEERPDDGLVSTWLNLLTRSLLTRSGS